MALHWYIKKKATDFKGFYIFLIAKRAEKDDFSQKSDEDGLKSGAKRFSNHINSTLRPASRSNRRDD
jgi:hypothetical protein